MRGMMPPPASNPTSDLQLTKLPYLPRQRLRGERIARLDTGPVYMLPPFRSKLIPQKNNFIQPDF